MSSISAGPPTPEALSRVAHEASGLVENGMRLGLGTGRAAEAFIRRLGELVAEGLEVVGVPTSLRSEALAQSLGIRLAELHELERLDIAFDGADEVTPELQLTKGLGGALLRERVVAFQAARFVVLVTPEKRVAKLGSRAPIPVEVVPFAAPVLTRQIKSLGAEPVLRMTPEATPMLTDNGNQILDLKLPPIDDPVSLERQLRKLPGVVDTGLFLNMADIVLVGHPNSVERLESSPHDANAG